MTRTLRGAWSRRSAIAPLVVLAAVLVAGLSLVLDRARDSGDAALGAPLALLGAVALLAPARAVADDRRDEAALARLRGISGLRLVGQLLAEALLALIAGGAAGLAVVVVLAPAGALGGLLVLLAVAGFGGLAVAGAVGVRLREPLADQVSRTSRPRAASVPATFAGLVALAAGGYAAFAVTRTPPVPGWLLDLAPALVGLAVGQLMAWLLRATARLAVTRSSWSRLGGFLAVRRLARRSGALAPLGLLVAGAVTAVVSATADWSAHQWVDQAARVRAGAAMQVPLRGSGAAQALVLTHRLDPHGRWLEAAAVLPPGDHVRRTVLLDSARFGRVSAPVLSGTKVSANVPVRGLAVRPSPVARDGWLRISGRISGPSPDLVRVRVGYVTDGNFVAAASLNAAPGRAGRVVGSTRLPGCSRGCVPTSLSLTTPRTTTGILTLQRLELGGQDLARAFGLHTGRLQLDELPGRLHPVAPPVSVIATPGAGALRVQAPDGASRSASLRARGTVLPLVGTRGTLADLGSTLVGALPTSPSARVLVLARADTPVGVLARLPGRPVTLDQVRRRLDETSGAARARTALLAGLLCLLVSTIALSAGAARQRRELAHEVAALRTVGLPLPRLRASVQAEVLACGLAALLASVLGGWLAVRLLAGLPLLTVPADAVPPPTGAPWWLLAGGGATALLVVILVVGWGRVVPEHGSRPALLREQGLG